MCTAYNHVYRGMQNAKCFFGFMLFIPHCTIDIYELFELNMKCLAQHFTLCMLSLRMILYFCWFTDACSAEAHWEWVIPFLTLHTSLCLNSPTSQPLVNVGISILAFPLFAFWMGEPYCASVQVHDQALHKCRAARDFSHFYSPS